VSAVAELGLGVHAGAHTGECEVLGEDLGGIAVHIGARVGALAGAGEVLVSKTVVDLVVGSGLQFADRGKHELKGVPGGWRLCAVRRDAPAQRPRVEPPGEYMTGADRLTVRLSRRIPGAMRALGQLAQRRGRGTAPSQGA
jgi:hypothetical protein